MANLIHFALLPLSFICFGAISFAGEVERDYFVFLTTGKTTQGVAPEEIQKKQAAHLDNFGRLAKLGSLTAAGPCSDPDKVTRGIVVINADSIAEAEAMFAPDPYVSEGFMKAELNGYKTIAGKLQLVTEVTSMEQSVLVILTQGDKWSAEPSVAKAVDEQNLRRNSLMRKRLGLQVYLMASPTTHRNVSRSCCSVAKRSNL